VFQIFKDPSGPAFARLWFGQAFSELGSTITTFALGFWFFQQTGQATPIYLTALAHLLPRIVLVVPAGVIADRTNPRNLMVLADLIQAALTGLMLAMLFAGRLESVLVYVLVGLKSIAGIFQGASEPLILTRILPQNLIGKAFGLSNAQYGSASLLGPIMGGALVSTLGLAGVLWVDLASFLFGALMTASLNNLKPITSIQPDSVRKSFIADTNEGFGWLVNQSGLVGLTITFGMFNFMLSFTSRLVTPLVLSRTDQDATALGLVAASMGLGNVVGGVLMGVTGSPKRKAVTVLVGLALGGFFEQVLMGFGRNLWIWLIASFVGGFLTPYYESAYFELFQSKTPAALLGRVLAVRSLFARGLALLSFSAAGIFADRLFEPAMRGPLGMQLQPLLGEGPGRGYALMMLIFGVLTVLVSLSGFLRPALVNLEQIPNANLPEPADVTTGDSAATLDPFRTLEFVWEYQDPSAEDFDPNGLGATLPRET
jgi:MFS transporter, DHA3 family, macrolide efflux protein